MDVTGALSSSSGFGLSRERLLEDMAEWVEAMRSEMEDFV
jgi:hypothetical protein